VVKEFDVIGIGSYCIDCLCTVSRFPSEDEKLEANDIDVQGGGNVATACVAVARLGGSVCYHGTVGTDDLTEQIVLGLKGEGVDVEHVTVKRGKNPLSFIVVNASNASRTIIYRKKGIPRFGADEVDAELIQISRVLLVDFYHAEASLAAARIANEAGIPVVVDAEKDSPLAVEILGYATDVVATERFALQTLGKGSCADKRRLVGLFAEKIGRPTVTVTLGSRGAVCAVKKGRSIIEQEAFRVAVADTTGAGDVFHGAYALFLAKAYPVDTILRYASASAAMKCRESGGRKGIPGKDELISFLEEYDGKGHLT
jgi:sulfofructose kinase